MKSNDRALLIVAVALVVVYLAWSYYQTVDLFPHASGTS
jgi:hypothetical protein